MEYPLFSWQKECLACWAENHCHGIVNAVTGSGKTVLALAAVRQLENTLSSPTAKEEGTLRIRIIVPTASLLRQWETAILRFFAPSVTRRDIGLCFGGRKDLPDRKFTLYVVNSARYTLGPHIAEDLRQGGTVLLIADECHHYASRENRKIFDFLPLTVDCPGQYASIGLSATPGKGSASYHSVLAPALGREIYRYSYADAMRRKTLCRFVIYQVALSLSPGEEAEYQALTGLLSKSLAELKARLPSLDRLRGADFFGSLQRLAGSKGEAAPLARSALQLSRSRKALVNSAQARIHCAVRLIGQLSPSAKIIVFGERIGQADALCERLNRLLPGQAARYHSAMDGQARRLVLERYQCGEIRILVSCRALDEGFDVPAADVGVVLSSVSVERQRIQRLGRILRPYEGKEIACLYYFYVANSSEEASFFSEMETDSTVCNLSFHEEGDGFSYPQYEAAAAEVLREFRAKQLDKAALTEAESRLRQGLLRPDWLLGEERCARKIREAGSTSERNYWICMKRMASIRQTHATAFVKCSGENRETSCPNDD